MELDYFFPKGNQFEYYCPYCKCVLYYIWHESKLIGMGLDKWIHCDECKRDFKVSINGFREFVLNDSQNTGKVKA